MTQIIIEDGLSLEKKSSIGNVTRNLMKILDEQGIEFKHKKCPQFLINIKNLNLRRFLHIIWLNSFYLIYLLFQKKPVNVLFTNYQTPIIKIKNVSYITFIHDIITYTCPQYFTGIQNFYSKFAINNSIKKADSIVVVSNTTKNDLISQLKTSEPKIKVLYNMLTIDFEQSKESNFIFNKYNLKKEKYILSAAFMNKRKNIPNLIKAYNEFSKVYPEIKLVLVGGFENDKALINDICSGNLNPEKIIFAGFVNDNDLITLYKNAFVYAFPSFYEGFGLPIIEAQTAGTCLLASNIPVFKEVAGENGALFCEPTIDGITQGLINLAKDKDLREQFILNGKKNVMKYNKELFVEQLLEILCLECKNKKPFDYIETDCDKIDLLVK